MTALIQQKMAELNSTIEVRRSRGFDATLPLVQSRLWEAINGRPAQ